MSSLLEYMRVYEFTKLVFQSAGTEQTGSTATTTATFTAHGLAVGDQIVFTALGGASGISLATRYYVKTVPTADTFTISATSGGTAVSIGSGTSVKFKAIVETEIGWANQAQGNPQTTDYQFEGSSQIDTITLLRGLPFTVAADAIPHAAHKLIFGKSAVTDTALPGGGTNPYGFGGGNDRKGVVIGARFEGNGIKTASGVDSTVTFVRWFPQCTITPTSVASLQTGQKAGTTGYTVTPKRATVDILGGAIAGLETSGEFFVDYEIA